MKTAPSSTYGRWNIHCSQYLSTIAGMMYSCQVHTNQWMPLCNAGRHDQMGLSQSLEEQRPHSLIRPSKLSALQFVKLVCCQCHGCTVLYGLERSRALFRARPAVQAGKWAFRALRNRNNPWPERQSLYIAFGTSVVLLCDDCRV